MTFTTLAIVILIGLTFSSQAEPVDAVALERTVTHADIRQFPIVDVSSGSLLDHLSKMFKIPISYEWSLINEDNTTREQPKIPITIQTGDSLSSALDRFCQVSDGEFRWELVNGIVCVRPISDEKENESLLDVHVSVRLQNVSVWEAFLELARAVNDAQTTRYLKPSVPFGDGILPPPQLREMRIISLNMTNVTAREVACSIMAASPFRMSYSYSNFYRLGEKQSHPSADLHLRVYDENHRLLRGPKMVTGEEIAIWWKEADSIVPK